MYRTIETFIDGTGEPEKHADGGTVRYCGRVYLSAARWDYQNMFVANDGRMWVTTDTVYLVGRVMPMQNWNSSVSNWVQETRHTTQEGARQEYLRLLMECEHVMTQAEFLELMGETTIAGAVRNANGN